MTISRVIFFPTQIAAALRQTVLDEMAMGTVKSRSEYVGKLIDRFLIEAQPYEIRASINAQAGGEAVPLVISLPSLVNQRLETFASINGFRVTDLIEMIVTRAFSNQPAQGAVPVRNAAPDALKI